jgi:hypothetical protein
VHVASDHREFDGLVFPMKRRVYPRGLFGGRVPFPVLVSIDASEFKLRSKNAMAEPDPERSLG